MRKSPCHTARFLAALAEFVGWSEECHQPRPPCRITTVPSAITFTFEDEQPMSIVTKSAPADARKITVRNLAAVDHQGDPTPISAGATVDVTMSGAGDAPAVTFDAVAQTLVAVPAHNTADGDRAVITLRDGNAQFVWNLPFEPPTLADIDASGVVFDIDMGPPADPVPVPAPDPAPPADPVPADPAADPTTPVEPPSDVPPDPAAA